MAMFLLRRVSVESLNAGQITERGSTRNKTTRWRRCDRVRRRCCMEARLDVLLLLLVCVYVGYCRRGRVVVGTGTGQAGSRGVWVGGGCVGERRNLRQEAGGGGVVILRCSVRMMTGRAYSRRRAAGVRPSTNRAYAWRSGHDDSRHEAGLAVVAAVNVVVVVVRRICLAVSIIILVTAACDGAAGCDSRGNRAAKPRC